jgi:hypothetical protein
MRRNFIAVRTPKHYLQRHGRCSSFPAREGAVLSPTPASFTLSLAPQASLLLTRFVNSSYE